MKKYFLLTFFLGISIVGNIYFLLEAFTQREISNKDISLFQAYSHPAFRLESSDSSLRDILSYNTDVYIYNDIKSEKNNYHILSNFLKETPKSSKNKLYQNMFIDIVPQSEVVSNITRFIESNTLDKKSLQSIELMLKNTTPQIIKKRNINIHEKNNEIYTAQNYYKQLKELQITITKKLGEISK